MATLRARLSTLTACSPSRCLRTRSSCDVRVHIRFRILPSSVFTLSRKNVPRLSPPRSRPRALGRAHLSASTVLAFRPTRATLHRLTVYGLANSCHVSTRASDDPLPFEDRAFTSHPAIAPALAFRQWRSPRRTTPRFVSALRRSQPAASHVDPLRACTSFDVHARNQPPLCLRSPVLSDRLPLATEASCTSVRTLRCVRAAFLSSAQIDLHLSTLTIRRHFRAHVRARVRGA